MTAISEVTRMQAVRRYDILDSPPDGTFDRVAALAADFCNVPIAIISIVDEDRIWFKSHHGLEVQQIDRAPGLCASAILQDAPWVVTDARFDARTMANPLVAGEFGLQFYVGVPLRTQDGCNLGTLCVIDRHARPVTDAQIQFLKHLAALVMDQMELRLSARTAIEELARAVEAKDDALRIAATMSREIDHRVMNSLQIVSGLLSMQGRQLRGTDAADQLTIAAQRVSTIARVHRFLCLDAATEAVELLQYVKQLCSDLNTVGKLDVNVSGSAIDLAARRVIPLGLAVNELTTNAAKAGASRVEVTLARKGSDCTVSVRDNGSGLPAGFDPAKTSGLGMKVVTVMVEQLEGTLEIGPGLEGRGSGFSIRFSASTRLKSYETH